MMHGGSKTVGARGAMAKGSELEDYFADLIEEQEEQERNDAATSSFHDAGEGQISAASRELKRLRAYVAHLKNTISDFRAPSQTKSRAPRISNAPLAARIATAFTVGLMGGVAARLLMARR